ncbi:hypothetical protein L599_001000000130 [Luteimonas sp. J16]|nr:hypothetical protein L599_001000000130 [Luteimonas sp. J16]
MRGPGHGLGGDGLEDQVALVALQRRMERQLQQPVGAVRHAVAPAPGIVEAAIVLHGGHVAGRLAHHGLALAGRHPRRDAVGARHFRQHQRRERTREALALAAVDQRVQAIAQRAQGGDVELARAHPLRQRLVGDAVAHGGIRIAQASGQRKREPLPLRRVRRFEAPYLERLQPLTIHALGRACGGRRGGQREGDGQSGARHPRRVPDMPHSLAPSTGTTFTEARSRSGRQRRFTATVFAPVAGCTPSLKGEMPQTLQK